MSTLVINRSFLKIAVNYLLASIFVAFFGVVYEMFSYGVYSYYMLYAFVFPLIGGVLPFLLLAIYGDSERFSKIKTPTALSRGLYHCGIATLTVGSVICGVLEIYGTTSYLTKYYWIVGVTLILTGLLLCKAKLPKNDSIDADDI
ncbi:MAG: hypothetical protein ACI4TK_02575 [Agathobacter sp.]